MAGQLMMLAENDAAIGLALRAQEVAARFGATDVRSAALNTQAACMSAKDVEWAGQMRRALDIALAGNHHDQAARAFANLCEIYVLKREFAQAERCRAEGIPYCDEHDLTTYASTNGPHDGHGPSITLQVRDHDKVMEPATP